MTDKRTPIHFIYLLLLAIFWGSAFLFAKLAVDSIPPLTIAAGRIAIGALMMTAIAWKLGIKLPHERSQWIMCSIIGVTGTIIPFALVNWSVQYVPSSLAAILMSLLPFFTIVLAHYLTHDEKFSLNKLIGIICGFLGIICLFYGTITDFESSPLLITALFGLLATSFFYSLSGVLIKRLKNKNPLGDASAMLISATIIVTPLALIIEQPWTLSPTPEALYSVLALGVFATGLASFGLFHLTQMAGVTFTSYNTYLIPLVGMIAGYIWLNEPIKDTYLISIFFIFCGIYLAEKKKKTP